jgi:hypothetical protein
VHLEAAQSLMRPLMSQKQIQLRLCCQCVCLWLFAFDECFVLQIERASFVSLDDAAAVESRTGPCVRVHDTDCQRLS